MTTKRLTQIGIVITVIGIILYFFPKINRKIDLFNMKQQCYKEGKELAQKNENRCLGITPEYAYNQGLNTCLIYDCYSSELGITKSIKNVFTNEVVISYSYYATPVLDLSPKSTGNVSEFYMKMVELFNKK